MRFGLNVSTMGDCADPRALATLAREAERAGWDGFFVWDAIYFESDDPDDTALPDPWLVLAAAAMITERIILGPIITPLSRRRPWKVARETVTLDHLSNGRTVLQVGLGSLGDGGFSKVGEPTNRKIRAEMLDESLAILDGLWSGEPFSFNGEHYQMDEMTFRPRPVQSPRIPVWVVAAWPSKTSMRRALRWDGAMPIMRADDGEYERALSPVDVRNLSEYAREHRETPEAIDVIIEAGTTPGDDPEAARALVAPFAEAGATWWIEKAFAAPGGFEGMRSRILQGPPKLT